MFWPYMRMCGALCTINESESNYGGRSIWLKICGKTQFGILYIEKVWMQMNRKPYRKTNVNRRNPV